MNSCPSNATMGPTFTKDQDTVVAANWTTFLGHAAGSTTWTDGTTDPNYCYYDVRNINTCNGSGETRRCRYANSGGTGCTAPGASLAWSPLTHDFGGAPVGGPGVGPHVFQLANTGTSSTAGCTAVTSSNTTDFAISPAGNCIGANNIPAGSNCTVSVTANPTSVGLKSTTLSRTCTTGGTATTTTNQIIVNGMSSCPPPTIASATYISPTQYNIALTGIDPSCIALTISKSSVSSSGPWTNNTSGCTTPRVEGVAGAGQYWWKATTICTGSVSSGDSPVVAAQPSLAWSPTMYSFGPNYVGTTTGPQTFTLSNTGQGSATGCAAILMKEDTTEYNLTANGICVGGGVTMAPGDSCTVDVTALRNTIGDHVLSFERACTVGGTATTMTSGITSNSVGQSDGTACANDIGVPGVPACSTCTNAPTPSPAGYCCPSGYSFGYRCGMTEQMQTCYDLGTGSTTSPQWQNNTWDCEN